MTWLLSGVECESASDRRKYARLALFLWWFITAIDGDYFCKILISSSWFAQRQRVDGGSIRCCRCRLYCNLLNWLLNLSGGMVKGLGSNNCCSLCIPDLLVFIVFGHMFGFTSAREKRLLFDREWLNDLICEEMNGLLRRSVIGRGEFYSQERWDYYCSFLVL